VSADLAVSLVRLLDALEDEQVVHLRDISRRTEHEHLAAWVAEQAVEGTLRLPSRLADASTALGYAVGLHHALRRADPRLDVAPPKTLVAYRHRLMATNNLLPDSDGGALVTTRAECRRPKGGPTRLADFFPNLRRIDADTFERLGWVRLPLFRDLPGNENCLVASVPFLAHRDDVVFAAHRDRNYYSAEPSAHELVRHVPAALAALDASGAQLAVLPEAALDDRLLEAWRDACRATEPPGELRLLLVGTGPVTRGVDGCLLAGEVPDDELGTLPHNRAVLLERATGELVMAQDKQRGFSMDADYRRRNDLLTEGEDGEVCTTMDELITDSVGLNVLDSRGGRIAILICEDLGRVTDTGAVVHRAGVEIVLAPILAPPILPDRWQDSAAKYLTPDGADVVVVNSIALGREDLDPDDHYKPRPGVPAASVVAITGATTPLRRPADGENLPTDPRMDALKVRVIDTDPLVTDED
jgi:predicted amidohydrolase